jgi:hypothetical protein
MDKETFVILGSHSGLATGTRPGIINKIVLAAHSQRVSAS